VNILAHHDGCRAGKRPFKCGTCSKSFNQRGNLRVHERIHEREQRGTPRHCLVMSDIFDEFGCQGGQSPTRASQRRRRYTPRKDSSLSLFTQAPAANLPSASPAAHTPAPPLFALLMQAQAAMRQQQMMAFMMMQMQASSMPTTSLATLTPIASVAANVKLVEGQGLASPLRRDQ